MKRDLVHVSGRFESEVRDRLVRISEERRLPLTYILREAVDYYLRAGQKAQTMYSGRHV